MTFTAVMTWRHSILAVAFALYLGVTAALAQPQQEACLEDRDFLLFNGAIHTMDDADTIVPAVRVYGRRIAAVGNGDLGASACTRRIDLDGRTVIPGIIDNHNHIVLLGLRPGHDTRLENARSIEEVLATLAARAGELEAGEWITSIGGFHINQFVPPPDAPRFPTLEELDTAAAQHPVYLQQSFAGPGVTNSLGKAFFESRGIDVAEDGTLAGDGVPPTAATRALHALRELQSFEDQLRGTRDAMRYAASIGVTTHLDQGGFPTTHSDADGAAHFHPVRAYDAVLALHRSEELINRIRLNFLHLDTDTDTPTLQARLEHAFPAHGDGMLRTLGIGEFTAGPAPLVTGDDAWTEGTRRVAEAGWRNENHSLTRDDFITVIEGWERIHAALAPPGIRELGWTLAHVPFITREYAERLDAIGGGVSVLGGWRWLNGTRSENGPPFRMLLETGIPVGMSSDGMQIAPLNPWIGLYYAVTGRNARGEAINADQTIGRRDALHLYTAANRWFLQEDDIGSIESGSYADLVVLSADYFDESAVPDEDIKRIHSLLTLVDGRIVHGDPEQL